VKDVESTEGEVHVLSAKRYEGVDACERNGEKIEEAARRNETAVKGNQELQVDRDAEVTKAYKWMDLQNAHIELLRVFGRWRVEDA
jgi:hypothetical protein